MGVMRKSGVVVCAALVLACSDGGSGGTTTSSSSSGNTLTSSSAHQHASSEGMASSHAHESSSQGVASSAGGSSGAVQSSSEAAASSTTGEASSTMNTASSTLNTASSTMNTASSTMGTSSSTPGNASSGMGNASSAAQAPTCNPAFGQAEACGGLLIGSWTIRGSCYDSATDPEAAALREACPGASYTVTGVAREGTLQFTQTTFARAVSGTTTVSSQIPASCATFVGGCAGFASLTNSSCTTNGDQSCTCTFTENYQSADTGTYTTNGGVVTFTPSSGSPDTWHYCVVGNGLTGREFDQQTGDKGVVVTATR